jgi:dCMP deaminase
MSSKWDTRFLGLAAHISAWSKDPSSQVGAVISDGNRIVSLGYNGFAAGVVDAADRLADRDVKLNLTIHAEENAMIFAKRDLSGCTVYVTHPPCPRCASKLIQEEIKRVVFIAPSEDFLSRWADDLKLSLEMYQEAGVEVSEYPLDQINVENAQITVAPGGFFKKGDIRSKHFFQWIHSPFDKSGKIEGCPRNLPIGHPVAGYRPPGGQHIMQNQDLFLDGNLLPILPFRREIARRVGNLVNPIQEGNPERIHPGSLKPASRCDVLKGVNSQLFHSQLLSRHIIIDSCHLKPAVLCRNFSCCLEHLWMLNKWLFLRWKSQGERWKTETSLRYYFSVIFPLLRSHE